MSLSASGSIEAGVGGGSLSATFSKTVQVDTSKTNILATVVADKGGSQLSPASNSDRTAVANVKLTDEASKLLAEEDGPEKFQRLCGDGFVVSRRDGGRLDVIFALSDNQRSEDEKASIKASGHYGSALGSASLDQEHRDILSEKQTSVHQLQEGGELTVPLDATAALAKITNYANFEGTKAHPYQITVLSYDSIIDPSKLKTASFFRLRSYLALLLRLSDMSKVYSNAALVPEIYYFPFQTEKDQELRRSELLSVAKATSTASICLDMFVTYCAKTGVCNIESVITLDRFQPYCGVLSEDGSTGFDKTRQFLDANEARLVSNLLIGLSPAFRNKQEQLANQTLKPNESHLDKFYQRKLFQVPQNAQNPDLSASGEIPSPYWTYMRLLAAEPLRRMRPLGNKGDSLVGDQLEEVRSYCANLSYGAVCPELAPNSLLAPQNNGPRAAMDFGNWVLKISGFIRYPRRFVTSFGLIQCASRQTSFINWRSVSSRFTWGPVETLKSRNHRHPLHRRSLIPIQRGLARGCLEYLRSPWLDIVRI